MMAKRAKVPGWDERGKVLSGILDMHTQMRDVLEGLGLGPDVIEWALATGEMGRSSAFSRAFRDIGDRFHESKVIKLRRNPASMRIDTAITPLLPYPDASEFEHRGRVIDLVIDEEDDSLWADNKRIVLHRVDLSLDQGISRTIGEVCDAGICFRGFNANLAFILRRHPEFIPKAWKQQTEDGFTPHIVLPNTWYKHEHRWQMAAMSWEEGQMQDSWTEYHKSLVFNPHSSWHSTTGFKPRRRIYIAVTED